MREARLIRLVRIHACLVLNSSCTVTIIVVNAPENLTWIHLAKNTISIKISPRTAKLIPSIRIHACPVMKSSCPGGVRQTLKCKETWYWYASMAALLLPLWCHCIHWDCTCIPNKRVWVKISKKIDKLECCQCTIYTNDKYGVRNTYTNIHTHAHNNTHANTSHAHTHKHTHTPQKHTHIDTHAQWHAHIRTHTDTHTHWYARTLTYTHTNTHVHWHWNTHTYAHIQTHIHMHKYTASTYIYIAIKGMICQDGCISTICCRKNGRIKQWRSRNMNTHRDTQWDIHACTDMHTQTHTHARTHTQTWTRMRAHIKILRES